MNKRYVHGPTGCLECFNTSESIISFGDWRLHNNPGYYGSNDPQILVLGFSKGANQNKTAEAGNFDKIAFAGARPRLRTVLQTLNFMPTDRDIDDLMTARETEFGVASLVRCSFCKMKNGDCLTSGDVIPSSFTNPSMLSIIKRCSKTFLGTLPENVKLVILLGTSDSYIKSTKSIFSQLYSDYRDINILYCFTN